MGFIGPAVFNTGVAASARRSFGELKRELALPINPDDDTTLAIAGDSINSAIRAYNRFCWPWEVLSTDIALTNGTDTYVLPQAFKKELSCFFLSGSRLNDRISYIRYDEFLQEQVLNQTGIPRLYTLVNVFETGQVTFYPTPGSSYNVRLHYFRRTPTMQRDEDPLEMPAEAEGAYLCWARYEMALRTAGPAQMSRLSAAKQEAYSSRAELVSHVEMRSDSVGNW